MDGIKAFIPPDVGEDEHIIRRLGWAVVRQWSCLPNDIQARIREQAVFTSVKPETVQLNEQIKIFIRKHAEAGDLDD